jgi:hypothetical protein
MEWIPVGKELPQQEIDPEGNTTDYSVDILCADKHGRIEKCYYDFVAEKYKSGIYGDIFVATHWIPMPNPPEVAE